MRVIRAKTAGFCMGVGLALRKLDQVVAQDGGPICTLGPIIHNPQVLEHYAALGVRRVHSPDEVEPGSRVVIRAHGIRREVEEELDSLGCVIVDATCPKVKRAQLLIHEATAQGRRLLLFGESEHPEVAGLLSYAQNEALVFQSLEELQALAPSPQQNWVLAAQTTQDRQAFVAIVSYLRDRLGEDTPVLDTICEATRERQSEAIDIARHVPAMIVAGGFESGNTRRLVEVARAQGTVCQHVETCDQLDLDALVGLEVVGLTAGASTPKKTIDAIMERLDTV